MLVRTSGGLGEEHLTLHFLFAIAMEALSQLLDGAVLAGHISSITVGPRSHAP